MDHRRYPTLGQNLLRKIHVTLAVLVAFLVTDGCFERGDRWYDLPPTLPECAAGALRCTPTAVERCSGTAIAAKWLVEDDCSANDQICVPGIFQCKTCIPDQGFCDGQDVYKCGADGDSKTLLTTCDTTAGIACRDGGCQNLCQAALAKKSNVGCEYWPVDLDNANISPTSNAAAQQFAVVVSNPQPDVPVEIRIEQDDSEPGTPNASYEIASATIAPLNLEVFKLGPREIDGSPEGEFNTGTHTALTRHAFKVTSDYPIVVYQFNPLENVSVFSNDASLLYPREALTYAAADLSPSYVVLGWPQTIAITDDPDTNFNPSAPINLRATLTIVGTTDDTHLRVLPNTVVVPGGPVAETGPGGEINVTIGPFDVLNLETGDFNADFTGSIIWSDKPVAVFSGNEASDAPHFAKLSERRCCADHLEDQLAPVRSAGKTFAIPHTPNRGRAVSAAGATIEDIPEPDYVRFIATTDDGAMITTSLPPPDDVIELFSMGDFAEVRTFGDFTAKSDGPVLVAQIMASQLATGVTRTGLPGGDPSLMMMPPLEQGRSDYVFLTPDKYAFDFVTVVAPFGAAVELDGQPLSSDLCEVAPADGLTAQQRGSANPESVVYRCQLGFPTIDPSVDPPVITPTAQNDGVHRVSANAKVLVLVTGFDAFVSYAYAAGTELEEIAPPM